MKRNGGPFDEREFDARLKRALHDAPIPAGLRDRLVAAVLAAPAAECAAMSTEPADKAVALSDGPSNKIAGHARVEHEPAPVALAAASSRNIAKYRPSRRSILVAGTLAASLLLGAGSWWMLHGSVDPRADLATLAAAWPAQLTDAWKPMTGAPSGFPASSAVRGEPRGWQSASAIVGRAAVVYDVSRHGVRAVLFAVRMAAPDLPFGPSGPPLFTGGQTIGAWRSGTLVYVLVVQGDEQSYRGLIRSVAPPLA